MPEAKPDSYLSFTGMRIETDPRVKPDEMWFLGADGLSRVTGLGVEPISKPLDPDVVIKAQLAYAAEAAAAALEVKKQAIALAKAEALAEIAAARQAQNSPNSLETLNQIAAELSQKATENIFNPITSWTTVPSGDLNGGGFIQSPYTGTKFTFPRRQDSVDDEFDVPGLAFMPKQAPPPKPKAPDPGPEPLSRNGGRYIMLEDPE